MTKVLGFVHIDGKVQLQEVANTVRSIAEIREVTPDAATRTITIGGTVEQIALTEWLLSELDQPTARRPVSFTIHASAFPGLHNPIVEVCYPANLHTFQQMLETVNVVHSLVDLHHVVASPATGTITLRGTPEQLAFAEWLIREADTDASGLVTPEILRIHHYMFPDSVMRDFPERRATVVRIYRPATMRTPLEILEAANAIRTIAKIERVVTDTSIGIIALRGSASQAALVDWLLRELDQPRPYAYGHEYAASAVDGDVVQICFLPQGKTAQDIELTEFRII